MSKNTNLLRALMSVSGMTLLSRIIGFLRDMIVARYFGAGFATDAFFVAFKLPNLLRRIFAEGAFSQAFVPILAEYKNKRTAEETHDFVSNVGGLLFLVLFVFTALGIIFAGFVIAVTAPGFTHDPVKYALTVSLLRMTFPYILFISLASMLSGILNTWKIFSIPAFTPTILNLSFLFFILLFRHFFHPPIFTLAIAVFVGGFLQLGFQVPFVRKIGMPVLPRFDFKNPAVWRVVKLMGPAIFAMSIAQISLVINTIFASFLPSGSVSWMYFADRLMEFPTGVLGVALGTILLPSLSKHASNKNVIEFSKTLDWGIKLCLVLALPATVGLAIVAKPLTMTLFMYGKFSFFDVLMTRNALIAYSVGLMGLIMVKVLGPGFYANQDIKTPVKVAIFVLVCTQIMNLIFIGPFKHAGLALSIGLGACLNAGLLCYLLIKKKIYITQSVWTEFFLKLIIAIVVMAIFLLLALHYLPLNFTGRSIFRAGSLLVLIIIASIGYFGGLYALGFRPKNFTHQEV